MGSPAGDTIRDYFWTKKDQASKYGNSKEIDELLRTDCSLYANLGLDSTKTEREEVRKRSINIYRTIKTLDKELGDEFLLTMNLKQ